jgi:anthranilate phosphoribosyltransferase
MSIATYIKEIGRGKEGARALSTEQALDLMSQVLDGTVTDLELGAFCLAMRIKGETVAELNGFVQATLARCLPLTAATEAARTLGLRGLVVLPSYNGARRLPNLTPLLAALLAREGLGVLVHGPRRDPTRVTTAEVFEALDWGCCESEEAVAAAWQAGRGAMMPVDVLCPGLARLLDVRWTVGLRNPGHTVAKLLDPWVRPGVLDAPPLPSVRVVNHTHPEYATSLSAYLAHTGARALLMRGTEGEPVADPRRQPRFEAFAEGVRQDDLSLAPTEGVLTQLPVLPASMEADVTAAWIHEALAGHALVPEPIKTQVACLKALVTR